jgi:hypothetical protein
LDAQQRALPPPEKHEHFRVGAGKICGKPAVATKKALGSKERLKMLRLGPATKTHIFR